jgi:hypothetical protein
MGEKSSPKTDEKPFHFTGLSLVMLLVGGAVVSCVFMPGQPQAKRASMASSDAAFDQSADKQAKRDDLIGKAISLGLLNRVEPMPDRVEAWTGDAWDHTEFDAKQNCIAIVHGRHLTSRYANVYIKDRLSGKTIGEYAPAKGLTIY